MEHCGGCHFSLWGEINEFSFSLPLLRPHASPLCKGEVRSLLLLLPSPLLHFLFLSLSLASTSPLLALDCLGLWLLWYDKKPHLSAGICLVPLSWSSGPTMSHINLLNDRGPKRINTHFHGAARSPNVVKNACTCTHTCTHNTQNTFKYTQIKICPPLELNLGKIKKSHFQIMILQQH